MRRLPAAAFAFALVAPWAAGGARAQSEPRPALARPVVLATSEGGLKSFGDPAACRSGWVVFHAVRDDGREGIYASAGSVPTVLAETGTPVQDGDDVWHMKRFGRQPTVSDALVCAFTVEFEGGGKAVLTSEGSTRKYAFVADSGEAFRGFGELAAINSARHVLFRATVDPPSHPDRDPFNAARLADPERDLDPESIPPPTRLTSSGRKAEFHCGLFLDRVSDLRTVCTTERGFVDVRDGFAFNDAGFVAFRASRRPGSVSLLIESGGASVALAESGARFTSFEPPALDRRGRAAFVAHGPDGAAFVCRSAWGAGLPEVVADARSGFVAFGPNVSIDDRERVAFVGRRADGREGLYLAGSRGDFTSLLSIGDLVGRRAVKRLRLSNRAFVRSDRIALLALLEPDAEAVVVLQLAP